MGTESSLRNKQIRDRFLNGEREADLARVYGISRQRAHQIIGSADLAVATSTSASITVRSNAAVLLQRACDRIRNEPITLLSLARHDDAVRLIFSGLHAHYLECIASGRLDVWKRAAQSAVDLLGEVQEITIMKRADVAERPHPA